MNSGSGTTLISNVTSWFTKPFNTQGSAFNWILFVGLLIIAVWFWNHILNSITE